ncbi:MAG: DUF1934 domain-containing protein [Faecousia sp.]
MKTPVMLKLTGRQTYLDQDPEIIELTTEGTIERDGDGWHISYEESELTGLKGVTTSFFIQPGKVTLSRNGALQSQMHFEVGQYHHSLYQMEFGALQITVYASQVDYSLDEKGGTLDLVYAIDIENTASGLIIYHLDVTAL